MQAVILTYRYFHLMFAFTTTWNYQYLLASFTEQGWLHQPISKDEALHWLGGQELAPSLWKRYSLVGALALIVLIVLFFVLASAVFKKR